MASGSPKHQTSERRENALRRAAEALRVAPDESTLADATSAAALDLIRAAPGVEVKVTYDGDEDGSPADMPLAGLPSPLRLRLSHERSLLLGGTEAAELGARLGFRCSPGWLLLVPVWVQSDLRVLIALAGDISASLLAEVCDSLEALQGLVALALDRQALARQLRRRRSEAQFWQLLEYAPDAVIGVDDQGSIAVANRRAAEMFGYAHGEHRGDNELVGQPVEVLIPEALRHLHREHHRQYFRDPRPREMSLRDVTGRRKDGSEVPVEVALAPLETDDGPLVCAAIRDVSRRRKEERRLARSQQQLQAFVDHSPTVMSVKDLEGRYLLVNHRLEELAGMSRDEMLGKTDVEIFNPKVAAALRAHDDQVLRSGAAAEFQEEMPGSEGPTTYLSVKFALCDISGQPYALASISTDISAQIAAQAEQEMLREQLEQAQRLESLGQLAGGVAHDFNNLLSVIINCADFIITALPRTSLAGADATVIDSIRSDAQGIYDAGVRAAALTRQLLIFARRDPVEPEILNLNDVIRSVEGLLGRTLGEDIVIEFSLDPDLWPVAIGRSSLEQVLLNASTNARDAMPDGGRLTIRTENVAELTDRAAGHHAPGAFVRLGVTDTGVGITPEVAAHAFEPFFTTKAKGHGTGLGLSTIHGIVGAAKGRVSLDSRPGGGTTLAVEFPAVSVAAPRPEANAEHSPDGGRGETILLVEDEEDVRRVAERVLAAAGYHVLAAEGAREAICIASSRPERIDLVLTDVNMPDLSGPALAEHLRGLQPDIPVVFLSGYPEDFLVRRCALAERAPLLRKPFTAPGLLSAVRGELTASGATVDLDREDLMGRRRNEGG